MFTNELWFFVLFVFRNLIHFHITLYLYHQNIEALALLTALKKEWADECETLLKEREESCNKRFSDELKQYRNEVS
jgi:hypothetical protein